MAVSKRLRYEILRRDNHACRYCGATAPDTPLTVDHVVPTALGGSDQPDNLVAACVDCNSGKSATPPSNPLVADVQADALRWLRAQTVVQQSRSLARRQRDRHRDAVYDIFIARNDADAVPEDYGQSVDQWIAAGLDYDDFEEASEAAARRDPWDAWRYFCGVCWNIATAIREQTFAALDRDDAP
jgi:hypothetical protein